MADCDNPAIQPLLAVFDAALAPVQPYIDFIFNQEALDPEAITLITGQVAPPVLPALPGIIQAQQVIEVVIALEGLPPVPALAPLPAGGISIDPNWNVETHGLAVMEMVVAMIKIPLDLVIGNIDPSVTVKFPDIIIESLPDVPGSLTLAQCIEERLPMFG